MCNVSDTVNPTVGKHVDIEGGPKDIRNSPDSTRKDQLAGKSRNDIGDCSADKPMEPAKSNLVDANRIVRQTKNRPLTKKDASNKVETEELPSGGKLGISSGKFMGTWDHKLGCMIWERVDESQVIQLDLDTRTQSYFPRVSSPSRKTPPLELSSSSLKSQRKECSGNVGASAGHQKKRNRDGKSPGKSGASEGDENCPGLVEGVEREEDGQLSKKGRQVSVVSLVDQREMAEAVTQPRQLP